MVCEKLKLMVKRATIVINNFIGLDLIGELSAGEDNPRFIKKIKGKLFANFHQPSNHAKISGATIVASLSTMYLGVFISSLPQVIFSFGTAPE
jgi:hypothetical protein